MFRTEICEILGIEYPIILGGMLWVGKSELVAAVSEAGGLGLLGAGGMSPQEIALELERVRQKTAKPFGVNIPLVRPDSEEMIKVSIQAGASVITTSSGSPKRFTKMIQDHGCKVMHVVPNVSFAQKCAAAGVDVIAAEGYEAGGHNGVDEIATMALIPQVVDAVDVPVVAAGGIADGRGFVAALALGAKGVQMGTRFLATKESAAHANVKAAVVQLRDDGTCVTGRTTIGPTRAIKNRFTATIIAAEKRGASPEELFEIVGEGRSAKACVEGDCEDGSVYCGQIGGHIRTIKSAREVIEDVIAEATVVVQSFSSLVWA
jgi:enoyl-[acyl-carrier protein] reductase II